MYLSLYCQSGDTWNIMKSYVNRYLDNLKANLIIIQPTITPTHQIQALNVSMSPRLQFFMIWYHYFRRCTLLGHTKRVQPQVGDERCLDEWWYSQLIVFLEWEQTCLQKVYPWGVAWFSMLKDGHNLFAWFLFFDQAYRIFCSWNAARCVNICSRKAWKRIFQIPKAEGFFWSNLMIFIDWLSSFETGSCFYGCVPSMPGFVLLGGYLIGVSLGVLVENFVCRMILAAGSWMLGWMSVA